MVSSLYIGTQTVPLATQKTFTISRNECANTVLFLQLNPYLYILFSRQQSLEDL